ncbi:MAG TPA: MMPL family transporter [Gammaproteobacteria bacterium]|nr:MMPL family transporter [Gammaproteobacteria bacterium]
MTASTPPRITTALERLIFGNRPLVIAVFALVTVLFAWSAVSGLRVDAGFSKQLPLEHEYMATFTEHYEDFGGADRILIALVDESGDMFNPDFFRALRRATDAVFFIPGVDRARVTSIFTPNVRYLEVTEEGIEAGDVIPADFQNTLSDLERVKENILKAGIVGRLVANDFSGAVISAQLLEINPDTRERLDYFDVARLLETEVRDKFETDQIKVRIIGFAKVVGDIKEGANRIVLFFGVALFITAILVFIYSQSVKLTIVPLVCSVFAVIWELGALPLLGFGIDPMGLLVPFLVFAIGVSHGVQMISGYAAEVYDGADPETASRVTFRRLLVPGGIALLSDTIGFITILFIDIRIIQEMAITASLGVAFIILTNLVLLPVLISYVRPGPEYKEKLLNRAMQMRGLWDSLSRVATRGPATVIIVIAAGLFVFGAWKGSQVRIGDLHAGVPELRPDSRYNLDTQDITDRFSIGVDLINVIVEVGENGCIDYEVMDVIDRFAWHMQNVPGVQAVIALPQIAKIVTAGWNEGNPTWRVLSRNEQVLVQALARVETSTGLLNSDCSVIPVMVYTEDHKAETIERVVQEVKDWRDEHAVDSTEFRLATGNVGVMAAMNEEVSSSQFPILIYVFGAVILLCWASFRSLRAVACIVIPLALVSLLAYALMAFLDIGLKVNTLPVAALGVGIGVDYGIYIYSRFQYFLRQGMSIQHAYTMTLRVTGNAVVFTGITLAIGVFTWVFSPLQFQADMGILLTFMFLVNMFGAILLLPALATWLLPAKYQLERTPEDA